MAHKTTGSRQLDSKQYFFEFNRRGSEGKERRETMSTVTLDSGAPTGLAEPPVSTGGRKVVYGPKTEQGRRLAAMLVSFGITCELVSTRPESSLLVQNGSRLEVIETEPSKLSCSCTVIRCVKIARPDDYAWLD